jgi:ADP-ribose pyrophosphatase YjhB (NUDIX family)
MQKRVRAIIVKDGLLLTIKRIKASEIYWVFPGGGVEDGESNEEALIRECREELGVEVRVNELVSENSFMGKDETEQKEYFYKCDIIGGELGTSNGPEYQENSNYEGKFEIEWIKIGDLDNYDLRPGEIKNIL